MEEYTTEEGHYFSEEDFLFNIKWQVWQLYLQGYTEEHITSVGENSDWDEWIDISIEIERIKLYVK